MAWNLSKYAVRASYTCAYTAIQEVFALQLFCLCTTADQVFTASNSDDSQAMKCAEVGVKCNLEKLLLESFACCPELPDACCLELPDTRQGRD